MSQIYSLPTTAEYNYKEAFDYSKLTCNDCIQKKIENKNYQRDTPTPIVNSLSTHVLSKFRENTASPSPIEKICGYLLDKCEKQKFDGIHAA
jgi:hypothetical protein